MQAVKSIEAAQIESCRVSIRPAISIEHRLVTDRQTDGHRHMVIAIVPALAGDRRTDGHGSVTQTLLRLYASSDTGPEL